MQLSSEEIFPKSRQAQLSKQNTISFQVEYYHRNPEIIYVHDLASKSEVERIKSLARGKMYTTPYKIGGLDKTKGKTEFFSNMRTSKVG